MRLQTEYNLLSTDRATHLITKSRFAVYDSGDKARKLLAQQARQAQSTRLIPKIYSETGETVTDHRDINDTFKEYYSGLYSSECDNLSQLNHFFDKLTFPSLNLAMVRPGYNWNRPVAHLICVPYYALSHLLLYLNSALIWWCITPSEFGRNLEGISICRKRRPETGYLKGKTQAVIAFTSLIPRRLILLSWKDQAPPNFTRWIRDTALP
ncbi:hypothetical protein F7725_019437 [Dissostichus mawsoni]|uniref:Reverse transcriptase n=1 Tax=Dissostichus mawsoni TaxID=36200 RepID=A0A7J5YN59_DISMA|nr:hypothetical protein F7725_019437 [Dissostichus mawsoni]